MHGRIADYTASVTGDCTAKCSYCYKKFRLVPNSHVYKRLGFGNGRKIFCSYHCMRLWEKRQQEKDRSLNRSARNMFTGKYEKKTMQEWAEEADIDYESLWYKNRIHKIAIPDAIEMLLLEEKWE